MGDDEDPWDRHATWWHAEFTQGADPEYEEQILPLAARLSNETRPARVLDIGCGEGQVARRIATGAPTGTTIVGLDAARDQLAEADRRGGTPRYAQAGAANLPVRGGSIDTVVVCLVLEHIDDLDGVIGEIGRALRPGGRLVLFLNHPLLQTPGSGWIDDQMLEPPERYWRVGPYLSEAETIEEVTRGVHIRFIHRPLSRYVNTLSAHGLRIVEMIEPSPPPGFIAGAPEHREVADIARLLVLVCTKSRLE